MAKRSRGRVSFLHILDSMGVVARKNQNQLAHVFYIFNLKQHMSNITNGHTF